jgi:hypothetical protein
MFSWANHIFYKDHDIISKLWTYHNDSTHCYIKGLTNDIIDQIIVNRQIRWRCFGLIVSVFGCFFPTVYKAVPSRDRAVTETTLVPVALFRAHLVSNKN